MKCAQKIQSAIITSVANYAKFVIKIRSTIAFGD